MTSFAQYQTEDRRLVILRGLKSAAQYRANALLLKQYCAAVGHIVSSDRMVQDIAWLSEQGLVTVEQVEQLSVATLTARGLDVAEGNATVPGVKRPEPGM
jgi:hypothetical protein